MPIQKRNRRQISDQDTFDYSAKDVRVSASEVNGYFERNPKTNDLVKALGLLPEVAKTAEEVLNYQNQKQSEAGIAARQSGDMNVEEKSKAYLKGWDKVEGQARSVEFKLASEIFLEQNKDKTPSEFKAGYDALIQSYTKGKSTEYLGEFFPNAINTQAQVEASIQKYNLAKVKENEIATLFLPVIQAETENAVLNVFREEGISINSLAELKNNPKLASLYLSKQAIIDKKSGIAMRKILDNKQGLFKEQGLFSNREELSTAYMQLAENLNIETGINFSGFINEKDSAGIKISNTALMEAASGLERGSLSHTATFLGQAEARFEKQRQEESALFFGEEVAKFSGMTDQQKENFALKRLPQILKMKDTLDPSIWVDTVQMYQRYSDYQPPTKEHQDKLRSEMNVLWLNDKLTLRWIQKNSEDMDEATQERAAMYKEKLMRNNLENLGISSINPNAKALFTEKYKSYSQNIDFQVANLTRDQGRSEVLAYYSDSLRVEYDRLGRPLTNAECLNILKLSMQSVYGNSILNEPKTNNNTPQQQQQSNQQNKNTPKPAPLQSKTKKVVKTGKDKQGRKVVQYDDGSIEYVK